jgi:hypothetical protein
MRIDVVIHVLTIEELRKERIAVRPIHSAQSDKHNLFRLSLMDDNIPRSDDGQYVFSPYCKVFSKGYAERTSGINEQHYYTLPCLPSELIDLCDFTPYIIN